MRSLVFIGSPGHTGTTLLDLLLGGHPEVVALGEAQRLGIWASRPEQYRCTCGAPVPECRFWRAVEAELARRRGDPGFKLSQLDLIVSKPVHTLHRRRPMPRDLLRIAGSPLLWRAAARFSRDVARELGTSHDITDVYEAAAAVTGASVVVDSSKNPGSLKNRYLHDPDRFHLVLQLRDGRGVAASQMRREGVGIDVAARDWRRNMINLLIVSASIPRRQVMRTCYEDLCCDPRGTLEEIGRFVGLERPVFDLEIPKHRAHNIGGNEMRFRVEEREICLDERWRRDLGPAELAAFERIGGRLNRFLGYR